MAHGGRAAVPAAIEWLEARWLRFMGDNSYSIYLIHMPVAGIVHHLVTGAAPGMTAFRGTHPRRCVEGQARATRSTGPGRSES